VKELQVLQGVKLVNYYVYEREICPVGVFTGADKMAGRFTAAFTACASKKSPKLTAICDGRNFWSSSSFTLRARTGPDQHHHHHTG